MLQQPPRTRISCVSHGTPLPQRCIVSTGGRTGQTSSRTVPYLASRHLATHGRAQLEHHHHRMVQHRTLAAFAADSGDDDYRYEEQTKWSIFSPADKEILSNIAACAGAALADPLMSLVDTAFVGRLGLLQLAALGPNAALFNVLFFLGFTALAVVATDQMASANSKGDREGVGRGFFTALVATLVFGTAAMCLLLAAPEQVLGLFQTNEEIMPYAVTYCSIRALCVPASMFMVFCQAAFRSLLDLHTPFLVVALSGLLNLVFDYIFIFVLGGGMAGAAWASVAAQYTGAALFCYMVYRKRSSLGLQAALEGPHKRAMAAASSSAERAALALASRWRRLQLLLADLNWLGFCKQAAALTLRGVLILSTYTGASMVAAKLGTAQIAGHQVVQQLQQLQLNVAWAFLNVGQSMVANVFHLPNGTKMARKVADRIIAWGIAAGVVMAASTWSLREVLPGLFVQDAGVLALVASAVLPACVMVALSFNNALEGCLIGAGDSLFVVKVYPWAVTFCMSVLALAYFSGAGLGGLWWAMVVYYAALVTMFSARYWVKSFRGKL